MAVGSENWLGSYPVGASLAAIDQKLCTLENRCASKCDVSIQVVGGVLHVCEGVDSDGNSADMRARKMERCERNMQ